MTSLDVDGFFWLFTVRLVVEGWNFDRYARHVPGHFECDIHPNGSCVIVLSDNNWHQGPK